MWSAAEVWNWAQQNVVWAILVGIALLVGLVVVALLVIAMLRRLWRWLSPPPQSRTEERRRTAGRRDDEETEEETAAEEDGANGGTRRRDGATIVYEAPQHNLTSDETRRIIMVIAATVAMFTLAYILIRWLFFPSDGATPTTTAAATPSGPQLIGHPNTFSDFHALAMLEVLELESLEGGYTPRIIDPEAFTLPPWLIKDDSGTKQFVEEIKGYVAAQLPSYQVKKLVQVRLIAGDSQYTEGVAWVCNTEACKHPLPVPFLIATYNDGGQKARAFAETVYTMLHLRKIAVESTDGDVGRGGIRPLRTFPDLTPVAPVPAVPSPPPPVPTPMPVPPVHLCPSLTI